MFSQYPISRAEDAPAKECSSCTVSAANVSRLRLYEVGFSGSDLTAVGVLPPKCSAYRCCCCAALPYTIGLPLSGGVVGPGMGRWDFGTASSPFPPFPPPPPPPGGCEGGCCPGCFGCPGSRPMRCGRWLPKTG